MADYLVTLAAYGFDVRPPGMGTVGVAEIPASTSLRVHAHPNPFNPRTTITYALTGLSRVILDVYDVQGRRVRRLVDGEIQPAGEYARAWDGTNGAGHAVASGIYYVKLRVHHRGREQQLTSKAVLLR